MSRGEQVGKTEDYATAHMLLHVPEFTLFKVGWPVRASDKKWDIMSCASLQNKIAYV